MSINSPGLIWQHTHTQWGEIISEAVFIFSCQCDLVRISCVFHQIIPPCLLVWMFYKYILKRKIHKNVPSERISLHGEEIQVQVYCVGAKLNWLTRLHKHKMRFAKFLVQCPPTLLLPTKAILSCSQKCDQKLFELALSFFSDFSIITFIQFALLRVKFEEEKMKTQLHTSQ